jgi:ElaA protein
MRFCVAQIHSQFGQQKIVLSAQAHLQDFYKKHNFVPEGATYLEDGIPHIHMIKL